MTTEIMILSHKLSIMIEIKIGSAYSTCLGPITPTMEMKIIFITLMAVLAYKIVELQLGIRYHFLSPQEC